MKKLVILHEDEVAPQNTYPVPVEVTGLVSSKLLSPPDYALWLCLSEFEEGATMTWPDEHSDQAIYVFSGEVSVGGAVCPERGAVIVESDVRATVTVTQRSRIGHWGAWDPVVPVDGLHGAIADADHRLHVVGPGGLLTWGDPADVAVRSFADSTCDTCRIALFEVTRDKKRAGRPHSHSVDEIIFLVSGVIELGAVQVLPGSALCIPGGVRYAEGSGEGGAVFINYRRESSDRTDFVKGQAVATSAESHDAARDERRADDVVHVPV